MNLFGLLITIFAYKIATTVQKLKSFKKLPAIILAAIILILLLKTFDLSYDFYNKSACWLTFLLGPATIALAYPLTQNIEAVSENKRILFGGMFIASVLGITITFILAKIFGASSSVAFSMIPKSVTTPIAIEISKTIGGIPELTACIVIITGIVGGFPAHRILNWIKIKNDTAKGLAIGATAHVLGTSRCIEKQQPEQTAISSVTLIVVAILTTIIAPILLKIFKLF